MKKQQGFSAVEAILIFIVILLLGFGGWLVWHRSKSSGAADKTATSSEKSEKKAEKKAAADPTDDWVLYTNAEGVFSFKHPASWVQAASPELCSEGLALFAPSTASVGTCASENGGQIQVFSTAGDASADYQLDAAYYTVTTDDPVTVEGVAGHRLSATVVGMEAVSEVGGYPDNTKIVRYIFVTGGKTYVASYVQQPSYPDVLSDFTLLVTETLKFSI
jgi:hypothetical protein